MKPARVDHILKTKATGVQKYQKFHKYNPPRIVLQSRTLIQHSSSELLKLFVQYRASKANSESTEIDAKEIKDNDGEGGRIYDLRSRNGSSSRVAVHVFHTENQEITISPPPKGMASKDARRGKKRSNLMMREEEEEEEEEEEQVDREEEEEELSLIDRAPPIPNSNGGDGASFKDIGGLSACVDQLKEMVLRPLLYPKFFESYDIIPSRGVLLCGPPGTGKTLTARALACEASKLGGTKVSFYMRKGADVLSKWVGESEKQLTLLFEEAQRNQPSIIFFDEIDGLAPARSSKQEQAHNSIVSTLLALMDGLDSRGQVFLMGATNRVDAIDGALRRPGRFDREFTFTLPDSEARAQILDIHTSKWKEPPSKAIKEELAVACVGYCGADLKALCAEAALRALRGRYPQDYSSSGNVLIDADSVKVDKSHFLEAMKTITPAAHRGSIVNSRPLSPAVSPCMHIILKYVMAAISKIFPLDHKTKLLLCGDDGVGLDDLGPAVLHKLEKFPVHSLALPSLFSGTGVTIEEALVKVLREARRSTPSILYLPDFNLWLENVDDRVKVILRMMLKDIPSDLPILLLGTSSIPLAQICDSSEIFSHNHVLHLSSQSTEDIPLLLGSAIEAPLAIESHNVMKNASTCELLPILSKGEERLHMWFEDICNRILKDERFSAFHHQALDIQYPMDITTLLQRVKSGKYVTCKSFVEEFNLILATAKKQDTDKMVIIRAYELRDSVLEMLSKMDPTLMIGTFY